MDGRLKLVQYVADVAQYFLRETNGLLPFAVLLDKKGEVKQLILDWQEDSVDARELATALEAVIKVRFRFDSIIAGVVCVDALYSPTNDSSKRDAIQMKLLMKEEVEYFYQTYIAADKSFVFSEIVKDNMTFDRLSELSE